jgi:hypothetical protein
MSELQTATQEILVHLATPGGGTREYPMAVGSSLGDLLRRIGGLMPRASILVDGVPPEDALLLHDGVVVTVMPPDRSQSTDILNRKPIPSFQDEELYQEYRAAVEARRERDRQFEDETGDHS